MADAQPKWSRGPGRSFADIRNGAGKRSLNPSHPKYREDSYAREMSDVAKDRETAFRANDAKERGNECLAEGNFRAAVQFYTTAINQHHAPEQHVYYSNRAAAYIRLQEWDEALADAERCVLVRPDWGKGYFRKGVALQGLRRLGEAVDAFRKGVVADPANEGLKKALEGATGAASAAAAEYEAAENDELHQAARKGDSGLIPSLLAEPGQDVNATNRDGQTPLHYAAWEGHVDCLQLLLDADADVNATNSSGQAPLHLAAWYGKDDAVEWLLARKADVNAQDAGGETALHHATRNSRLSTCRALLEAGCKALTKSSSGQMAFNIADDCCPLSTCKHDDIADLLDPWMEKEATAAEAAAAAESSVVGLAKIPKGTVVTVKGLQSATEHNGKQGQVEDYVEERGRFMVELDEGGVMLALKEVNLVVKTNKKKRGAKPAEGENTSVYVAGLPTAPGDCSENHLSTFFGRAGKVFKVKLYKQAGTGALKGDALVTYMSSDEADQSCALLNKQSIRSGYPISVKRADFSQSESKKKVRIKPEITKTFHGEGGLGINFGEAWEIEDIDEESQAEVLGLRPAIWLSHIQGDLIVGKPDSVIVEMFKSAGRPITLGFITYKPPDLQEYDQADELLLASTVEVEERRNKPGAAAAAAPAYDPFADDIGADTVAVPATAAVPGAAPTVTTAAATTMALSPGEQRPRKKSRWG